MKKKYRVVWNEVYCCSKVVEAESEEKAKELCYDCDDPDQKVFGSYEDWGVEELDENEDN